MNPSRLLYRAATTLLLLSGACAGTAWALQAQNPPDPTIREVKAGDLIKVARLPDEIYLRDVNDPDEIIWDRIPAYRIFVTAAPPVHPSVALRFHPDVGQHLYFQLARTAERFYVRLRWQDESENRATTVSEFRDGVALQFSLGGLDTSYMMGSDPIRPVNIWYWRADTDQIENLAAGGFGSTTRLPEQPVTGESTYRETHRAHNNQWRVVMSRELASAGGHNIDLRRGIVPVAFALWQGAENQRDGNKRVSHNWLLVDVAGDQASEPSRPPASGSAADRERERAEAARKQERERDKEYTPDVDPIKLEAAPKGSQFY